MGVARGDRVFGLRGVMQERVLNGVGLLLCAGWLASACSTESAGTAPSGGVAVGGADGVGGVSVGGATAGSTAGGSGGTPAASGAAGLGAGGSSSALAGSGGTGGSGGTSGGGGSGGSAGAPVGEGGSANAAGDSGAAGAAGAGSQTELVSRSSAPGSVIGNGFSLHPSLSADGRWVAFSSAANNLDAGDLGTNQDIFVYDRQTQLTKRLTKNSGNSIDPVISADGKHVAFTSDAANLVTGDTNGLSDIFVYDLQTDTIERVSVADNEAQANGASQMPDISGDGNFVVWSSTATNLVMADTNGKADVFVRDRLNQATVRVSVSGASVEADQDSINPQISDNGSVIAFQSQATKLVDGVTDPNTVDDIFVRSAGVTRRISRNPATLTDANGYSERPALSADGKVAAFASLASNLVLGDDNAKMDVFVYNLSLGTVERVSVTNAGDQSDGFSSGPSLSADGSRVVFDSLALDLAGANNGYINCYLFDRSSKKVFLMNGSDFGGFANGSTNYRSVISNDGTTVAFHSAATNLVVGDDNGVSDAFVTPYAP
jgi:Tol biopolymer transport system component